MPFAPASFDHVFVCFVLEHLSRPAEALSSLKTVLKPGGSITVIEGDHGSASSTLTAQTPDERFNVSSTSRSAPVATH